jgi:hypothetical protein
MKKTDKPIRGDEPFPIPYRDPVTVEKIIGKIRKAVQVGTGFFEWPLWRAHPTWHQFHDELNAEREAAEKEGRPAHPSAAPPVRKTAPPQTIDSIYRPHRNSPSNPLLWVKRPKA